MFRLASFAALCVLCVSCSTVPHSPQAQLDLQQEAAVTSHRAAARHPAVQSYMQQSSAYAVFPRMGKGGFIIAGGYGRGVLYEKGAFAGYCDATQLSVGVQIGGQAYTEFVFFQSPVDVERFKLGGLAWNAQVAAVAADQSAAQRPLYRDGAAVIILDANGLMAEAAAGGQKFRFAAGDPK